MHSIDHKMPNVAVHDLVIQPVEKDLIIATHGRSIQLNISALQNFDTNQKGEKYLKLAQLNTPKSVSLESVAKT